MAIDSGFSHEKWWFSNIFHSYGTVYQRAMGPILDGTKAQVQHLGLAGQVGLRLTEESGPFLGPIANGNFRILKWRYCTV